MASLSESITQEVLRIGRAGLAEVRMRTVEDNSKSLLRRFRAGYDKLSPEQIGAAQQALGHEDTEERPCKICRLIAQKEFDLAED